MIDTAYCLCYDKRWQENSGPVVQLQLDVKEYLGLDLQLFWAGDGNIPEIDYDHIDIPKEQCAQFLDRPAEHSMKGHGNAFLCHRKMFWRVYMGNYERVLFLEDDAYFIKDRWKSLRQEQLDFIKNGDYDGLYLGWQGRECANDSDDMERIEHRYLSLGTIGFARCEIGGPKISGLHGMVMTKKFIEQIMQVNNEGPMDHYIGSYMVGQFDLHYIRPKIIGSKAGFSYCENKWQDRSELK